MRPRRSVDLVRRVAAIFLLLLFLLLSAVPALAQGRDPFRPPAGAGSSQGGGLPAPEGGEVVVPSDPGRLPRTGQDVVLPAAAALALIVAGGALRLTGRLLAV